MSGVLGWLTMVGAVQSLTGAGMQADVALDGDVLRVHIEAPGPGWVAFGISDRAGLRGAHLAMVAVLDDGSVLAEHHVADPPQHHPVQSRWIRSATGKDGARTTVDLVLVARGEDAPLDIQPGSPTFVTLAWSVSDDLTHHSAARTEVVLRL